MYTATAVRRRRICTSWTDSSDTIVALARYARSRSRGANLLPPFGRETIRAANYREIAAVTLSAGSRLGPYEILAPIGAGGMGEVYRAKDPRLCARGGDQGACRRRSRRTPTACAASSRRPRRRASSTIPTSPPSTTSGPHDGAPYVVQELLEGETLRAVLAGGKLPPRKAIDYALQIAHGLAAAHDKGIVHRDLKPENLFVTNDGRVKILDFGLAKLTQLGDGSSPQTNLPTAAGTEPGMVMGTIGYMSPEQIKGKPADARSDIFSFGAILYEMLSGKRAFHARLGRRDDGRDPEGGPAGSLCPPTRASRRGSSGSCATASRRTPSSDSTPRTTSPSTSRPCREPPGRRPSHLLAVA